MFLDVLSLLWTRFRDYKWLPIRLTSTLRKGSPEKPDMVSEKKKAIIHTSYKKAILISIVHIAPITICTSLIVINAVGFYVGPDLSYITGKWTTMYTLAVLQFTAKILDLLIASSLTTIVFQLVWHQVLQGDGLSLTLLVSPFSFTKLGYFFSRSVWMGTLGSPRSWLRILFILCILLFGIITLVAGPASALLLIPRTVDQPIYNPKFWLSGTSDDLWPVSLTSAHIGDFVQAQNNENCSLSASISNIGCVSKGYPKILDFFSSMPGFFFRDWHLVMREPKLMRVIGGKEPIVNTTSETWAYAPHVATALRQWQLWWVPSWFFRFDNNGRSSTVKSNMTAVRTVCLQHNVTTDTTVIDFPDLKEFETYTYDGTLPTTLGPNAFGKDGQGFEDPDTVRTVWINNTDENFTAKLIIMEAMANVSSSIRSILACAVDARWVQALSQQSDMVSDAAITAKALDERPFKPPKKSYTSAVETQDHAFLPTNGSWLRIAANLDFLNALTPVVPYLSPTQSLTNPASTISNIFMSMGYRIIPPLTTISEYELYYNYDFYETAVSTLVADGISRIGYSRQLESATFYANGTEDELIKSGPPPDAENFTEMQMNGDLLDIYVFKARVPTDFGAIAILALYIVIATTHTAHTLFRHRTPSGWQRLEDFAALLINSRQAPLALGDTCSGIDCAATRAKAARIVVVGPRSTEDGVGMRHEDIENSSSYIGDLEEQKEIECFREEEVQLIFVEEAANGSRSLGRVEPDVKYGKHD